MVEISPLIPVTYSMLINDIDRDSDKKNKSIFNYINREKLALNFKLDFTYEDDGGMYGDYPGFVSKSYFQSSPEIGYCYPPKGPIEKYFVCTYCKREGPKNHTESCRRPLDSSLVLTQEGTEKYTGRRKGTSYLLIVKKAGQKKVITDSLKSELFYDSVQLIYMYPDKKKCTIRISRNGTINIISARFTDDQLPGLIVKKINESGALTDEFKQMVPKYVILPKISNKYLLFAQFNLYPEKNDYHINLTKLNDKLWNNGIYKKEYLGNTVLMLDTPTNNYVIENFIFNSGDILSRSNRPTPSMIKFIMTTSRTPEIKVSVVIYTRGAIQLRASHIKGAEKTPLTNDYITHAYDFLKEIFKRIITESNSTKFPIIVKELLTPKQLAGINNTIDGKQPQACMNRDNRIVRPVPFSFYGKCEEPGTFVAPRGILRKKDGKYEPCCYKIKKDEIVVLKNGVPTKIPGKDSKARYDKILINGYPDEDAIYHGEVIPDPDKDTAVYSPGTDIQESRRFKGLKDFSREELMKCMEDTGYIEAPTIFNQKDNNYSSFQKEVLGNYSKLSGTKSLMLQGYKSLSYETFKNFTKYSYVLTPVLNETIHVLLYFNETGKSYFINLNNDVSDSGLPVIAELKNTLIEGNLYPYKEPNFIFYPVDIIFYNSVNITNKDYYTGNSDDRFTSLMYVIKAMNSNNGILITQINFDLDIIQGSKYYIENMDISGLLFIPYTSKYTPKVINKDVLLWSNTLRKSNLRIGLVVTKIGKNIWSVSIDGKIISPILLPQADGGIEIPIKWSEDNNLKNGDTVLFKILLNLKTNKINVGKPLVPLEKIDFKINYYSDVISILQSVQTPISASTFTARGQMSLGNTTLVNPSADVSLPLTIA